MLKVLKSKVKLTKYSKEFATIRHGNYYEFISLIGEPTPFMVLYREGKITTETAPKQHDIDFVGLYKAGPSLKLFYQNCIRFYGVIDDADLSDKVFRDVALFEISLRMHAKNNNLLNGREDLVNVIDKLCEFKKLSQIDNIRLQNGRHFLNMIKHDNKKFVSWKLGLVEFEKAFETLKINKLTVV